MSEISSDNYERYLRQVAARGLERDPLSEQVKRLTCQRDEALATVRYLIACKWAVPPSRVDDEEVDREIAEARENNVKAWEPK